MLYSIVDDPKISAKDLNDDLETIRKWAFQWKLEFNPDVKKQATEILFSCKISNQIHPNLYFDGNKVVRHNYQKHLGLTMESNLSFKQHILDKINTAKKCLIMIRRLSNYFPLKTLSSY